MTSPIEELRRAHEATTQGEWTLGRKFGGHVDIDALDADIPWQAFARVVVETEDVYGYSRNPEGEANARFIALAHREWPTLLDRIDALEAENARLREAATTSAHIVSRYLYIQTEKVEDVSRILRTAIGDPT